MSRRALVVSIVHHPLDARIHYRQIAALREAGWLVTQVAPWSAYGVTPPDTVDAVEVERASGRRRIGAILDARRRLRRYGPDADVVLLHDPELLLSAAGLRLPGAVVWDVHEDTAGAVIDKPWLPAWLRPSVRRAVRAAEAWAERTYHLTLAEHGYVDRFRRRHPVVANHPVVPDEVATSGDDRVVYVGRISTGRGVRTMLGAARLLGDEVTVRLIGPADADVRAEVEAADAAGHVEWLGFRPNDEALALVEGACAGLALLRDEPNYVNSLPTKVVEYLGRGVVPITTPLPQAVELVEGDDCGVVVPFDDPEAVVAAVRQLRVDGDRRRAMAERGRKLVREELSWNAGGPRFVALLERWASEAGRS